MTKISRKPIDPEKLGHYINNLWSAFTLMDSKEDIRLLFKDLFTHTEYKMFAKRLEIARRLLQNDNYQIIQRELNVTPNTINRISNILAEKGEGLRKAHEKLLWLEEKFLAQQRERTKNLEDPFRRKIRRKTVLGAVLKASVDVSGKVVDKKLKQRSARRSLPK